MEIVTIPKIEYQKLRSFSTAYVKIAEDVSLAERNFPYDYKYIDRLTKMALREYKNGEGIEAESIDVAIRKSPLSKK